MSLAIISKRLRGSHPQLLALIRPTPCTPSPFHFLCCSHRLPSSSSPAFRLSFPVRSQAPLYVSTLQSFSTQTCVYPFDLIDHRIDIHGPVEPGLLESLKRAAHFPSEAEAMACIDASGIKPNKKLVRSLIWELREEWRLAFLVFKWGEKWVCVDEKACELIVWVLGNHRKFNIAWLLMRDMHKSLMNARQAMLIMIDRYAATNNPGKAINAFRVMEKFRMTPDEEAFYALLTALCKHGNIEEAEEFMLVNKKLFPLQTEAFNIVLNGWCNICLDVLEAKRVWREMSKYCITPNATSYTHMISCFSKVGNLFDSLRLYDEMRKRGWVPGIGVYNSLIYVLTRENCIKEALKILDKIKDVGLRPNCTTYNSMILPLCQATKLAEARNILATMMKENVSPTTETYHAFLEGASYEGTLEVLKQMRIAHLSPTGNTFFLILVKFFKLEQPENALKIWAEMKQYEVVPDLTHYKILVEGLARCGFVNKAREYYAEMRSSGYSEDPKLQKILMEPLQDKNGKRKKWVRQVKGVQSVNQKKVNIIRGKPLNADQRKKKSSE